jgi:hypothetical protein
MDMKKILQALDGATSKPVEGSDDIKKTLNILTEGTNPHKVSLPVQMAMQHYAEPTAKETSKPSLLKQYFAEAEESFNQEKNEKRQLINQYAKIIAERVQMKESVQLDELNLKPWEKKSPFSKKGYKELEKRQNAKMIQANLDIDDADEEDDPEKLKKAEDAWFKARERRKRASIKAQLAKNENAIPGHSPGFTGGVGPGLQSNQPMEDTNPKDIVKLDIPLLIRLLEYAREDAKTDMDLHNVTEKLINFSKKGKVLSMAQYDAIVGEQKLLPEPTNEACWKGYQQIGMKKKGKKTVPNCVPKRKK